MFIKPTRSGGHTYLQLVESYRNDAGQPRQRTVASLGSRPCKNPRTRMNASFPGCFPMASSLEFNSN